MSILNFLATISAGQDEAVPTLVYDSYISIQPINGLDYLAFGNILKINDTTLHYYIRNGGSHVSGGRIERLVIDITTKAVTDEDIVINDGVYDLRGGCCAIIDDSIYQWSSRYDNPNFIDNRLYKSTDGLTGLTFDSGTVLSNVYTRYNYFPDVIQIGSDYYVSFYGHQDVVFDYWKIVLRKYNSSGVYQNDITVYDSQFNSVKVALGESTFINVDDTNIICIARNNAPDGLWQLNSNDAGLTWSEPVRMNLGLVDELCNASAIKNSKGLLDVVYMNRFANEVMVSWNNEPGAVFNDPTKWNAGVFQYQSTGTQGYMLGYPSIMEYLPGKYCITFGDELTGNSSSQFVYGFN